MLKNWFARLDKKSALKRLTLVIVSNFLTTFGISCYYVCALGSDPISVFVDGQHAASGLTYGEITTINNVILVVLMFIFARKYFNIGTIISCFLTGPLIDLFVGILSRAFPADTTALGIKIGILVAGVVVFGFGLALFIAADIGIGAFEFLSLTLSEKLKINLRWVRITLDAMFVGIGWLLGGKVGVGTIAGVLLTGPILTFFLERFKKPLSRFFGPLFKEEEKAGNGTNAQL